MLRVKRILGEIVFKTLGGTYSITETIYNNPKNYKTVHKMHQNKFFLNSEIDFGTSSGT